MFVPESLVEIAREVCPLYEVRWGFYNDLMVFLSENSVTRPLIYIAVGPDFPHANSRTEDGVVTRFYTAYDVFVWTANTTGKTPDVFGNYLTLRDAFNGVEIATDNGPLLIQIISGERTVLGNGTAHATLTVTVG